MRVSFIDSIVGGLSYKEGCVMMCVVFLHRNCVYGLILT